MPETTVPLPLASFETLGDLLKFLRRRARISQRELSIAVGYSESQISRLERNRRPPDLASLAALFAPALHIEGEPDTVARMLELAALARGEAPPEQVPVAGISEAHDPQAAPAPLSPPSSAPKHNLPLQVTRFFGREAETAQLVHHLREHRLVTLTGAGGVGKTRLSLRVGEQVGGDFSDGVFFVELATLADPVLVPEQVAATLGVRDEPGRPLLETLTVFLRGRQILLVLDNCEHLLQACARLAEALLRACPRLRILASSREPLAVYGEAVFQVPSLPFPDASQALSVEHLDEFAAVGLFADRARLVQPEYRVGPQDAAAVAYICQRLDGIPLAIEMAAARMNLLTAEQLAGRLDETFSVLTAGSRTALPQHQTLHATIDWSYQLLNETERLLLRRLSVFAGGCTLEAAETVCADRAGAGLEDGQAIFAKRGEIVDVLGSLVAKSMVVANRSVGGAARYRMLEMIRQYAWEKVLEAPEGREAEALQARHLDYFAAEAEYMLQGPARMAWLDRLDTELVNVRAALKHSQADSANHEKGLRLAVALTWFWSIRGHYREAHDWLEAALGRRSVPERSLIRGQALYAAGRLAYEPADHARAEAEMEESVDIFRASGAAGKRDLAYALIVLGDMAHGRGDFAPKVRLTEESVALFREVGDQWGLAFALHQLAPTRDPVVNYQPRGAAGSPPPLPNLAPAARNDHTAERALFEESLALFRELGDRWGQGMDLFDLGLVAAFSGDRVTGRAMLEECLAISREFGHLDGIADCLIHLGNDALAEEDLGRATMLLEDSLALYRRQEDPYGAATIYCNLGEVERRRGDTLRATQLEEDGLAVRQQQGHRERIAASLDGLGRVAGSRADFAMAGSQQMEALAIRLEAGHPINLAYSFHALAVLAAAQGQAERAARLFGAAAAYHPALFFYHAVPPIWGAEHERSVAAIRAQLGEARLARLWAEGEAMTLEQAVSYALEAGKN